MTAIQLTPSQHAILSHALDHAEGRIEWFRDNIKRGACQKVLDGLAKRELIRQFRTRWRVTDAGRAAMGRDRAPEPGPISEDAELQAAVAAAEATWAKLRTRAKQQAGRRRADAATARRRDRPANLRCHRLAGAHRARRVRRGVGSERPQPGIPRLLAIRPRKRPTQQSWP